MATRLPYPSLISQNCRIKTKRKPFSQKRNEFANFILIIYVWRAKIKHALIQKRSEIT